MCGISGFNWKDESIISKMNFVNRHRGPDDEGIYLDEKISLGHRRLSIIDLSDAGHQPMTNEDSNIWLVYNGEIYNAEGLRIELIKKGHVFKSNTDSEVIIHAYEEYGMECLDKFNGMWAFGIYDKNKGKLFLVRDRFGIKPLYYYHKNSKFIFSSMIGGILSHKINRCPNDKIVFQFLAFNLIHHSRETFINDIYSLEPGHFLTFDLNSNTINIKKWYTPQIPPNTSAEVIKTIFQESVRLRTIADVPIGSCLSGGIDSSSIVCSLDRILDSNFNTFSLVIPGHRLDESKYIKEVGGQTKTKQFFTTIEKKDFIDEIEDFIKAQEEPVSGLSVYAQYRVMKLAHENDTKVLLDGQGSDEIFTGYFYHFAYYFRELLGEFRFLKLLKEICECSINLKDIRPALLMMFILLPGKLKNLIYENYVNKWINHSLLKEFCGEQIDPRWQNMNLQQIIELALFKTSIPHLLMWEDKNAMRWSVESRVPFLDVNLVEAALGLPSNARICSGRTKVCFRNAIEDILPEIIKNRRDKIGFATSENEFFKEKKIVEYSSDLIYSQEFKDRPYWKWAKLEKNYSDYLKGKCNIGQEVMKWTNLELWFKSLTDY